MELISIIVPVYNAERYLITCVRSILSQTYSNLELILVDDGSTDKSGCICDELEKTDARIRVIHTSNGGAARARNIGLDSASGNYLIFVDSDDQIYPDMCNHLMECIKKNDADCVVCGYETINEEGKILSRCQVSDMCEYTGMQAIRERYASNGQVMNIVNPWGKIYRKNLWAGIRFDEGMYYEDLEVMPRLYQGCRKLCVVPYVGCLYLVREGSLSHGIGTDDKRVVDSIKIRVRHIEMYRKWGETSLERCMLESLLDLIVTSAGNDWIPQHCRGEIRQILSTYYKRYLSLGEKGKIQYSICYFLGFDFYRRAKRILNR